jgi:hypothetical protein
VVQAAVVFAVLSVVGFTAGFFAFRRRRFLLMGLSLLVAVLCLSLAGLCATVQVAVQGYRALTREEVAAVVETRSTGPQTFVATFDFPDGRSATYSLAGDELYVDAHILKWKPIANVLGLHTAYELDRVAGRYATLEDEQERPRSVFSLAADKPVDMFHLRRRFWLFRPVLDTEYGSATFVPADRPATYELRVSTTGLLIRREPQ